MDKEEMSRKKIGGEDTRGSQIRTRPSEGPRRRRRDEESSRGWICTRDAVISLPAMLLLLVLLLVSSEAESVPASESGCPQEVSVSIFSPMQGDVVSEGVSLLSFEVTAKRKYGSEGMCPYPSSSSSPPPCKESTPFHSQALVDWVKESHAENQRLSSLLVFHPSHPTAVASWYPYPVSRAPPCPSGLQRQPPPNLSP